MKLGGDVYCGLVMSLIDSVDYLCCAAFMYWAGISTGLANAEGVRGFGGV